MSENKKRIFLFAAYDPEGLAGPALLWYLQALHKHGEIILCMDNECSEIEKLNEYCLHTEALKHNEYDFGSYKRAFAWASEHMDLGSYDYLYLVNDSVFGPLEDISGLLESMEALEHDAFSLVYNPHRTKPHLQSWFIGLRPSVFREEFFSDFMESVRSHDKIDVCELYETGLTRLLSENGKRYGGLFTLRGKAIYNKVRSNVHKGIPFIKRTSFTRHNGSIGTEIRQVLGSCSPECRNAVVKDAERLYGKEYTDKLLSNSCLKSKMLYLKYLWSKLFLSLILLGFSSFMLRAQEPDFSLFLKSDSLQVHEIKAEQGNGVLYSFVGHHGPAVESSHSIFRLYFNESGAIDLYSKSGGQSELRKYLWYPDEQERATGAGEDAYLVGRSLGIGGIALWDGEKIVRLKASKGRTARVGDIIRFKKVKGAFAELIAYGVICDGESYDISIRIETTTGKREAKITAKELNGRKVHFVTGIKCDGHAQNYMGRGLIAVWNSDLEESESRTEVGTALKYKGSQFPDKPAYDGQMYYLISKKRNKVSTSILGASNLESELCDFDKFIDYIN